MLMQGPPSASMVAAYAAARPFPHLVLDNWFGGVALESLHAAFAHTDGWHQYEDKKRGLMDIADHPLVAELMGEANVAMLRTLTGIPNLVSDPTMRGGGLHALPPGGRLGIHVDFNRHPDRPLRRAVNTLLYLNKDWDDTWGGRLIMTNRTGESVDFAPRWNRWVIFGYSETAWHGHPEPLTCPPDRERRSLALYYYTPMTEAEDKALKFHTTIYAKPTL